MEVSEWEWDDENVLHQEHGLTALVVEAVAGEAPRFRRNRRGRSASHQMIGPDHGGQLWTVCIVAVDRYPGRWRAITGWRSEPPEIDWYRRTR